MKLQVLLVVLCAGAVLAQVNPLTQATINANALQETMHYENGMLRNPHMRSFYDDYYTRPQQEQKVYVQALEQSVGSLNSQLKQSFPFRGYSPIDPNIYNRFVYNQPINTGIRDLRNSIEEYNELKSQPAEPAAPNVDPAIVAQMKETLKSLHRAKRLNHLQHAHAPSYPRPFESQKMHKLADYVDDLEKQVNRPLAPTPPNPEELAAINRLNDKLEEVSKRIHAPPTQALKDITNQQNMMLQRLTSTMRRMANAIKADRRESFLNAVHMMIHRHHLHDHPFMMGFEDEIAHSIATGLPLRDPDALVEDEFSRTETKPATPATPATPAIPSALATPAGPTAIQKAKDPKIAKDVAKEMKDYGKRITARGKELGHRAEIAQRRLIPYDQSDELNLHLRQRLNSPPTEVHVIGAARPTEYDY
jgi:hypothetical protein